MIQRFNSAFTLLELLVVVSIIGLLAGLVFVSFTTAQKQARDATRKSDLKQYATSLETYANKNNGLYLINASAVEPSTICNTLTGSSTGCPKDPKTPTLNYSYCSDSSGTQHVLWATLENQTSTFWVACSSGKVNTASTAPTCGLSFNCFP